MRGDSARGAQRTTQIYATLIQGQELLRLGLVKLGGRPGEGRRVWGERHDPEGGGRVTADPGVDGQLVPHLYRLTIDRWVLE